ncbi:Ubiquitin-protein ligase E3A [Smittium mucronatum]|uniref:HECT-type E3 ubiquitin transferase n=1 Tax=Smittium mucronatum TaxID=133383 RepID=A0A1R0H031_9FUNG|nr:Ubiquitin-protein ligase E3A [Smittium mucronatum]
MIIKSSGIENAPVQTPLTTPEPTSSLSNLQKNAFPGISCSNSQARSDPQPSVFDAALNQGSRVEGPIFTKSSLNPEYLLFLESVKSLSSEGSSIRQATMNKDIFLYLGNAVPTDYGLGSFKDSGKLGQRLASISTLKKKFYLQLTNGCGNSDCKDPYCFFVEKRNMLGGRQKLAYCEYLAIRAFENPFEPNFQPHLPDNLSSDPSYSSLCDSQGRPFVAIVKSKSPNKPYSFIPSMFSLYYNFVKKSYKLNPRESMKQAFPTEHDSSSNQILKKIGMRTHLKYDVDNEPLIALTKINQSNLSALLEISSDLDHKLLINSLRTILTTVEFLFRSFNNELDLCPPPTSPPIPSLPNATTHNISDSISSSQSIYRHFNLKFDLKSCIEFGSLISPHFKDVERSAKIGISRLKKIMNRSHSQFRTSHDYNSFLVQLHTNCVILAKLILILSQVFISNDICHINTFKSLFADLGLLVILSIRNSKDMGSNIEIFWRDYFREIPNANFGSIVESLNIEIDAYLYEIYYNSKSEYSWAVKTAKINSKVLVTTEGFSSNLRNLLYLQTILFEVNKAKIIYEFSSFNYIDPSKFSLDENGWIVDFDFLYEYSRFYRHSEYLCSGTVSPPNSLNKGIEENFFSILEFRYLFPSKMIPKLIQAESFVRMKYNYLSSMVKVGEIGQLKKSMLLGMDFTHSDQINSGIDSGILSNIDPQFSYMADFPSSTGWTKLGEYKSLIRHRCNPYLLFGVRRSNLLTDSIDMLVANIDKIGYPLKVRFVDSGEDGLDMGGIQKEFFNLLLPKILDPDLGLFRFAEATVTIDNTNNELFSVEFTGEKNYVWPNGGCPSGYLEYFQYVGMFLGIAFNNMVLLDNSSVAPIPRQLLDMLLVEWPERKKIMTNWRAEEWLDYCKDLFPVLVEGLRSLYNYGNSKNDIGSVQDVFCHTFDISLPDPFGTRQARFSDNGLLHKSNAGLDEREEIEQIIKYDSKRTVTIDLVDNGREIFVTESNRDQFICKYLHFLVITDSELYINKLREGFLKAGGKDSIKGIFSGGGPEDQELVGLYELMFGEGSDLDIDEWKSITKYENGYSPKHKTIIHFWEIVEEFSKEEKRNLLRFVTGSSFLPLGGFKNFSFVLLRNGSSDSESLPTSQTCFSRLLIPPIKDKEELRQKLLISINNYYGFGLV